MPVLYGAQYRAQYGARYGQGTGFIGGIPGVTRDASGQYTPANATEWATFMTAIGLGTGNPSLLWGMQESSGTIGDSIGAFTGNPTGTVFTYATPVSGWSRVGLQFSGGGTNQVANVDTGLPDLGTTSMMVLAYILPNSSGGLRDYFNIGTTKVRARQTNGTGFNNIMHGANTQSGTIVTNGQVHPFALRHNKTAGTSLLVTDLNEKLIPTFDVGVTGKSIQLGDATARCPSMVVLYLAAFFGAAAELTDAQLKTLLQGLGWTIPWT